MKTLIFILTFFLFFNFSYAQHSDMYEGTESRKAQQYFDDAGTYYDSKEYEKAETFYLLAIIEDSSFVEAYDNLGLTYRKMNNLEKAIEYYKKSIDLYPEGSLAHQNFAVVYGMQKKYEESIAEYQLMINISPLNPEGHYGIANTCLLMKEYEKGIPFAEAALKLYRKENSYYISDGYYLLGLLYYYNENYDYARYNMNEAEKHGKEIHNVIKKDLSSADTYIMEIKEDYVRYEEDIVDAVDWLIETPVNEDIITRANKNALVLKWISGCPYVSVELNEDIVPYIEECPECMMIFMGGWVKHAIRTKDYANTLQGSIEGTYAVIQFYNNNKTRIENIKSINKLIKLKSEGKLESYIEGKL
jgi:tetratricopeptide (TPR) repeat protein